MSGDNSFELREKAEVSENDHAHDQEQSLFHSAYTALASSQPGSMTTAQTELACGTRGAKLNAPWFNTDELFGKWQESSVAGRSGETGDWSGPRFQNGQSVEKDNRMPLIRDLRCENGGAEGRFYNHFERNDAKPIISPREMRRLTGTMTIQDIMDDWNDKRWKEALKELGPRPAVNSMIYTPWDQKYQEKYREIYGLREYVY